MAWPLWTTLWNTCAPSVRFDHNLWVKHTLVTTRCRGYGGRGPIASRGPALRTAWPPRSFLYSLPIATGRLHRLRADLIAASLVLARELSDTGTRTDLDDAIAAFGFDRADLEAELDEDIAAGRP